MNKGHLLSAAWDLARASMFWVLHVRYVATPGRAVAQDYRTYRTEATLLITRDPQDIVAHDSSRAHADGSDSERLPTVARCAEHVAEPTAPSEQVSAESLDCEAKNPVDLHIASSPRALIATRSVRHSDRHARGLRSHGKHIGFVVDSGCTYHMHP
eukprot:2180191-Pleurochrysis_carterae.AAC.1